MKLFPNEKEKYILRHNPIWEDLIAVLKEHKVSNYSIFLDETTNILFGYLEIEDEELWDKVARTEPCKNWWNYMSDIMETNSDYSPKSTNLIEVFHLD